MTCHYDGAPHPMNVKMYWQVPAEGYTGCLGQATVDICNDCHELWLARKRMAERNKR